MVKFPKIKNKPLAMVLGISGAIHGLALVIFGSFTLYQFLVPPEPEFEPPPPLERIEPQKLEYKARTKDLQKNSSKPRQQRIAVKAISQINTPDVQVELPNLGTNVAVGAGTGVGVGLGTGLGSGALGFGVSAVDFMGVKSKGERILIVFDVSKSVVTAMQRAGAPITDVRDKTVDMINELSPGTLFGLIQHSRNYDVFKPELVPAFPENKAAAIEWLNSKFVTSGASAKGWTTGMPNGIQLVMKAAFQMKPDLIFLLSDASYQRTMPGGGDSNVPWDELKREVRKLQDELSRPAVINFIGFSVDPEDAKEMGQFIRGNDGVYKEYEQ